MAPFTLPAAHVEHDASRQARGNAEHRPEHDRVSTTPVAQRIRIIEELDVVLSRRRFWNVHSRVWY